MEERTCTICTTIYPATADYFYQTKRKSKKRGEFYDFSSWCKICQSQKSLDYYRKTKEARLARKKVYRIENKAYLNKFSSDWTKKNPERARENTKNWGNRNKERVKFHTEKRKQKTHEISDMEWLMCKKYFDESCAYCNITYHEHKEIHNQDLHREHVDHEGSNKLDNCIPSCKNCNSAKYIYSLEDWYTEKNPNFTEERLSLIHQWLDNDHKKYIDI